jgi:hypothetical protein
MPDRKNFFSVKGTHGFAFRVFHLEEGRRRLAQRETRNKQSWSIDFYNGRRARCVTCDTLKGRPTGIDGEKRLMSLIPEQALRRSEVRPPTSRLMAQALTFPGNRSPISLAAATRLGIVSTPQLGFAYASAQRAFTSASSSSP